MECCFGGCFEGCLSVVLRLFCLKHVLRLFEGCLRVWNVEKLFEVVLSVVSRLFCVRF